MDPKEVRRLRKSIGWTQARLADAVGVAENSIARYERGEMGIKEPVARLIQNIVAAEKRRKLKKTPH